MQKLNQVDAFLVGWMEKHIHRFQKITGLNNFWVAKQVIFVETIAIFLTFHALTNTSVNDQMAKLYYPIGLFIFGIIAGIMLVILPFRIIGVSIYERYVERAMWNGLSNAGKIEPGVIQTRLIVLLKFTVMNLFHFSVFGFCQFTIMSIIFYTLGVLWRYLLACDPLPGDKGKFRKWLESLNKTPVTQPIAT